MDISHTREERRFKWIYPILKKGEGLHGYIPYWRREKVYISLIYHDTARTYCHRVNRP